MCKVFKSFMLHLNFVFAPSHCSVTFQETSHLELEDYHLVVPLSSPN